MSIVVRFWRNEAAATAIEYCLLASIVAIAVVGGATQIGARLKSIFGSVSTSLN